MKIIYSILIALITLQLIACGGAEERKAAYLEKAEKSLKSGDLDKARIEIKNVLQIDPKDARAYFKLGYVFELKRNYRQAYGYYLKAAELDPNNLAYQAKLGRFYLVLAGNIDKATEKMNLILSKDKNNISGLLLKAGILLKQKKLNEARDISEELLKDHPEDTDNVIFLTEIYNDQKDYDKSIRLLNNAIKRDSDNQQLMNLLATTLFLNKDYDGAEKVFKDILNAHSDVFQNYTTLALFYEKRGDLKKAENVLRSAISAKGDDVQRKLVLIKFIDKTKGHDAAIDETKVLIKQYSSESTLRLILAQLYLSIKNTDAAIDTYKRTADDFSEEEAGITSRVNLARIYLQKHDIKDATDYIEKAASIAPNDTDVNFIQGNIAIQNRDYEKAIISLRTVVKNAPSDIDAYLLLAASHRANNESKQADEILDNAYQNNRNNPKGLMQLAKYYLQSNDSDNAGKIIDDYLKLVPDNYDALSIKASILSSKKSYAEVNAVAEKIRKLYPDKDNGYVLSASILMKNKKVDDAIRLLNDGYKITKSIKILNLKSQLQVSTGKVDDAISAIKSVPAKERDEKLQITLYKAYEANNDKKSAEDALLESIDQDNTRVESYMNLASFYQKEKNIDKSISILNQGIIANPDNRQLAIALANFYELSGDLDSAINIYDSILAINPNDIVANNNLATLLVDHKSDPESLKRAKEIIVKLKDVKQPAIMDTVGWVHYKLGDYTDALSLLKKVVTEKPEIQIFNYHLGMAYYRSGDKASAKTYLKKSLEKKASFKGSDEAKKTLNLL